MDREKNSIDFEKIYTLKPVYLEHVDNWFLKLILYYFNEYIFKNPLSTCSRQRGFTVFELTEVINSMFIVRETIKTDMSLNGELLGAIKRLRGSHVG